MLTVALSDILMGEWKPNSCRHFYPKLLGNNIHCHQTATAIFLQLYFSMSSCPNWDNSNLFWQPNYTDKLLMDGCGGRTLLSSFFYPVKRGIWIFKSSKLCLNPIGLYRYNASIIEAHCMYSELSCKRLHVACCWIHETVMWLWGGMESGDRSNSWESPFSFSVGLSALCVCLRFSLAASVNVHTPTAFRVV